MSSRRKFFLVFCFILLDMFLVIGFLVIMDATILNDLKNEVNELSKLDITKDRYNRRIKSRGNYAVVEKAIKEYLDEYALSLQEVFAIMNDEQLTKMLSYDNYMEDGPEFKESLNYLSITKEDFNEKIDKLIDDLEEDNISNYINSKIADPYYISLYRELMFDDAMKEEFADTRSLLKRTKKSVNNIFDVSTEVLNFLILNNGTWTVEDGEIKFLTVDLYNYYNSLIGKVNVEQNSDNKNPVDSN